MSLFLPSDVRNYLISHTNEDCFFQIASCYFLLNLEEVRKKHPKITKVELNGNAIIHSFMETIVQPLVFDYEVTREEEFIIPVGRLINWDFKQEIVEKYNRFVNRTFATYIHTEFNIPKRTTYPVFVTLTPIQRTKLFNLLMSNYLLFVRQLENSTLCVDSSRLSLIETNRINYHELYALNAKDIESQLDEFFNSIYRFFDIESFEDRFCISAVKKT